MKILRGSRMGTMARMKLASIALVTVFSIAACGGGDDPFGGASGASGDSDDSGDAGGGTPPDSGVTTAMIIRGKSSYDTGGFRVINSAFAVLDANGAPIYHLDGGDFHVLHGGDFPDSEAFHDAQKLTFGTHIKNSRIAFLFDTSNSLERGEGFEALKEAAADFVTEMVNFGLAVDFYQFNSTRSLVGTAVGDPAPLVSLIDSLSVADPEATHLYELTEEAINEYTGNNYTNFSHDYLADPDVRVDVVVLLTDGHDNTGMDSSLITDAKANAFNVFSIAVGEQPNLADMEGYSDMVFKAPEGGTSSDAVTAAVTGIKNYYSGFYLVDYMPPTITEGTESTYSIEMIANDGAGLNVTYSLPFFGNGVDAYCCKIHVNPSLATTPVVLNAGDSLELKAVRLWDNVQPTFEWSVNNSDGGMTIDFSGANHSVATVKSNGPGSNGILSVSEPNSGWTSGDIHIEVQ